MGNFWLGDSVRGVFGEIEIEQYWKVSGLLRCDAEYPVLVFSRSGSVETLMDFFDPGTRWWVATFFVYFCFSYFWDTLNNWFEFALSVR